MTIVEGKSKSATDSANSREQAEQYDDLGLKIAYYEQKLAEQDDVIAAAEFEIHRLGVRLDGLTSGFPDYLAHLVWPLNLLCRSIRERGLRSTAEAIFRVLSRRRPMLHWRQWRLRAGTDATNYRRWIRSYDRLEKYDCEWIRDDINRWTEQPLVSVVLAAEQGMLGQLKECLLRIEHQLYPQIEVVIVVPQSYAAEMRTWLQNVKGLADRINIIPCAEGISDAEMHQLGYVSIRGVFSLHPNCKDHLSPAAIYLALLAHRRASQVAFIFSDEDQLNDLNERNRPFFKPQKLGELQLAFDVAGATAVFVTSKVRAVGGPDASAGMAWRWDLILRLTEKFGPECGLHIPFITIHRRQTLADAAKLIVCGQAVVASHLQRSRSDADVGIAVNRQHLIIRYHTPKPLPLVTAIVTTRDRVDLLKVCLADLLQRTDYPMLEVIVVDNDSKEVATKNYFDGIISDPRVRVIHVSGPFNFANIHNAIVPQARGKILALVNNDVEVIGKDWLRAMVAHAVRPSVGVVGAKLIYPANTIQHAGVVMGLSGGADHIFRGVWAGNPGRHYLLNVTQNVAAVTGACMVLRRSVYLEVGGMDPRFGNDFNDVDICLKIRNAGYEVIWTPEAELIHRESASRKVAKRNAATERQEVALLKSRWREWIEGDPYYNPNLALDAPFRGLAFPPRIRLPWINNSVVPASDVDWVDAEESERRGK